MNKLILTNLEWGFRDFLLRIHPDRFWNSPKAFELNGEALKTIQPLVKSLKSTLLSEPKATTLHNSIPKLVLAPSKLCLYVRMDSDSIVYLEHYLPFSHVNGTVSYESIPDELASNVTRPELMNCYHAAFNLFLKAGVPIDSRLMNLLSEHVLHKSYEQAAQPGLLFRKLYGQHYEHEQTSASSATDNHQAPILDAEWEYLQNFTHLRFDAKLALHQKRLAIVTILSNSKLIDQVAELLGTNLPLIIITDKAIVSQASIKLPFDFAISDLLAGFYCWISKYSANK